MSPAVHPRILETFHAIPRKVWVATSSLQHLFIVLRITCPQLPALPVSVTMMLRRRKSMLQSGKLITRVLRDFQGPQDQNRRHRDGGRSTVRSVPVVDLLREGANAIHLLRSSPVGIHLEVPCHQGLRPLLRGGGPQRVRGSIQDILRVTMSLPQSVGIRSASSSRWKWNAATLATFQLRRRHREAHVWTWSEQKK